MVGPYEAGIRGSGRVRIAAMIVIAALSLIGCGARGDQATLVELSGLNELKEQFNRDAGKPRLVLLLSPT